ncbi:MAG: hypothetical protein AAF363_15645 [Bacteroidota bacterium]
MKNLELSIQTLSVEIKVLSIDQKRMTASVFNQIRKEPFFTKDFQKRGQEFGYVNKDGYWLVWSNGSELRKTEREFLELRSPSKWYFSYYLNALVKSAYDFSIDKGILSKYHQNDTVSDSDRYELLKSLHPEFEDLYYDFWEDLLGGNKQLYISI